VKELASLVLWRILQGVGIGAVIMLLLSALFGGGELYHWETFECRQGKPTQTFHHLLIGAWVDITVNLPESNSPIQCA